MRSIIANICLNFIRQIDNSKKCAIKGVLKAIKHDTQSVTGKNLREIMFLVEKSDVCDLIPEDAMKIAYKKIPESEEWRVSLLNELNVWWKAFLKLKSMTSHNLFAILDCLWWVS